MGRIILRDLPKSNELSTNLRGYICAWLIVNDRDMRAGFTVFKLPYFMTGTGEIMEKAIMEDIASALKSAGYCVETMKEFTSLKVKIK